MPNDLLTPSNDSFGAPGPTQEFTGTDLLDAGMAMHQHPLPFAGSAGPDDLYVHPNESEDDPYIPHEPNNPFAATSELFKLDLREEDVADSFTMPGVQAKKPSIMLSPEEREAQLQSLLQDEAENVEGRHLILEFGPLAALEKRLRSVTKDFADPDVAEAVMNRVRRCIHEAVVSNTLLGEKERTEAGLMARIEAVKDLSTAVAEKVEPLLDQIQEIGVDLTLLRTSITNTIEVEERRLDSMAKTLQPNTIGNRIFEGIADFKDALVTGLSGKQELVGDLRRTRNEQLGRALENLSEVSFEMRNNAGDPDWEREQGPTALNLVEELGASIQSLTKGVEDQVDFGLLNKGMNDVRSNLTDAAEATENAEQKARMQRMLEFINAAIEALERVIQRVFGRKPESPTPARMTP